LRADRTDGDPDKEAGFQILRESEAFGIPAVLVEFGFFDNPTEAAQINLPDIRNAWAQRLAKVLAKF
jgi:N-acetylmuramoyl-L-alanine amidase